MPSRSCGGLGPTAASPGPPNCPQQDYVEPGSSSNPPSCKAYQRFVVGGKRPSKELRPSRLIESTKASHTLSLHTTLSQMHGTCQPRLRHQSPHQSGSGKSRRKSLKTSVRSSAARGRSESLITGCRFSPTTSRQNKITMHCPMPD